MSHSGGGPAGCAVLLPKDVRPGATSGWEGDRSSAKPWHSRVLQHRHSDGRTNGVSAKPQSAGCCLPVHERPWAPQLGQHGDNMAIQILVSRRLCSKSTQQGSAVVLALLYGQAAKHLP